MARSSAPDPRSFYDNRDRTLRAPLILLALLVASCAALAGARSAEAGPWILPEGVVVIGVSAGTEFADEEFLTDGRKQAFPLSGRFSTYQINLDGRYGFGRGFELNLRTQIKGVNYVSEPLLIIGDDPAPVTEADYRRGVLSFNKSALGVGDLYAGIGYQHLDGAVRLASSVDLKVPTGYDPPEETFRDGVKVQGAIGDDVTLGDGKVAAEYRLHLGSYINASGTLLQAHAGYRARFNGPGHQAIGEIKLGQSVDEHLLFFAGVHGAFTLFEGEVIGETLTTSRPEQTAIAFDVGTIEAIALRLDQDYIVASGGVLVRFAGREVVLTVSRTLWGANFPLLTGVHLGTVLAFE